METAITFNCQGLALEGRLALQSPSNCVLVTHPHPLYGGDMDNTVVTAVAEAYRQKGWSSLRFNFRGKGASQGRFDNGRGEQLDIDAAIAYLKSNGFQTIDLAGYSFGAWVLANWSQNHRNHPHAIRLVAPPVAFIDFSGIDSIVGLKQVVVGSRDDLAPHRQVELLMRSWRPEAEFNIIQQADHFFGGCLEALQQAVAAHIAE